MRTIRPLITSDQTAFIRLMGHAYPGIDLPDEKRAEIFDYRLNHDDIVLYGSFDGDDMLGIYRLHRFEMNLFGRIMPVGGLGGVGVDLPYKKEKVCLEMVKHFHRESRERGALLSTLYPFDIGFYRRMGYGVCTFIYQYKLHVTDFPKGDKRGCGWITNDEEWLSYYNAYAARTHGMMIRSTDFGALVQRLGFPPKKRIGVWRSGRLTGCMEIDFSLIGKENPFHYRLEIRELLTDTPEDLGSLLAFVRDQEDQVQEVILHIFDPNFHLSFPTYHPPQPGMSIMEEFHIGPRMGYGLMIRVLDLKGLHEAMSDLQFGTENLEVVFDVRDNLIPTCNGPFPIVLDKGRLIDRAAKDSAPRISIDIADFSSFIIGAVSLESLFRHHRLQAKDASVLRALDRAFAFPRPPECWTIF